ncbi:MAG: hypothetical protein JETCAE03_34150 [Ignavibacteriaceae bacterium]|jgi:hypothetical protein|nr:MAG: hypothetical protein JETCAE03_34150 [Ignavibacteriaceae bacterium]
MNLTPEQLVEYWEKLIAIIEKSFSGERKERLLKLYNDLQDRILYCPASYKEYFHGAFPGGYLVHVLNVVNFSILLDKLWTENGATRSYSDEELVFSALHHDLGKIGDLEEKYYIEHNEKWRKDRGEIYMINPKIRFMSVPDRSLWLLNHYGISVSQTETIAILLHDGMYDEGNKNYLQGYSEYKQLDDNLPIVLHHADMMAMSIERDQFKESEITKKSTKKSKPASESVKKIADDFFKKE